LKKITESRTGVLPEETAQRFKRFMEKEYPKAVAEASRLRRELGEPTFYGTCCSASRGGDSSSS
jgi:hypothetical protein